MSQTVELQPVPTQANLTLVPTRTSLDSSRVAFACSKPTSNHQRNIVEPTLSSAPAPRGLSMLKTTLIILQPSLVNFLSSFTNGIITVGLPHIALAIDLPRSLYLWPTSVYGLTSGAILLIAGSVADIVGARIVEITGILLLGAFTLACGLSTTGIQLVVFRALQGVGFAMHLPASVALVAGAVPQGRARNIGFACLGLSQPLGFSVGMVVSGIIVEKAGWRTGFYISGGATIFASITALWTLPKIQPASRRAEDKLWYKQLYTEVDWAGGVISGGGLATLAYILAVLSADLSTIRSPTTASLLALSIFLLFAFPFWMAYRERSGKAALIPNSLWKRFPFTATCIMVALSYAMMNSMELFSSLYFQEVQKHSPITASLYLLPSLLVGTLINLAVGYFVDRVQVRLLVTVACLLCSTAPLMMAVVDPAWSYWYVEFWAQALSPVSADVLFTVGLVIVSESFPEETQALAGAVFSTVGQFGQSLGIGLCQVVALSSMGAGNSQEDVAEDKQLRGYRAGFWTMFAYMIACGVLAAVGLKRVGKVGVKRE